jgi:membrane-bound serine protease (ClpP class)
MNARKPKLLLFILTFFISLSLSPLTQSEEILGNKFLVLSIDNAIIGPVIADYITCGIDKAQEESFAGVIIQMDTPGGLLESTRVIVKKMMNATIPVIVYIAPAGSRAGSAGVFITLASHIAAMAPSTNIGAAHPVALGEGEKENRSLKRSIEELIEMLRSERIKKTKKDNSEKQNLKSTPGASPMEDKILNDTLAWISTIAKSRNRNAIWARQAVSESISATEKEALDNKVINLIALDLKDLLKTIDGITVGFPDKTITLHTKNAQLITQDLSWSQNILNTLINPNIAYILMLVGFLGLFIEITHPGVIVPGIVGIISLILAFYAFAILPINFAGLLLIIVAIVLFIGEALTPISFGILTLTGAIAMFFGSLMLIDSTFFTLRVSIGVILPFVLSIATIVIFLATNVVKTHRRKVQSGVSTLIGKIGMAQTDIVETGQVFLDGEIWTALNQDQAPILKGQKVKVLGIDKVKLLVSKYVT